MNYSERLQAYLAGVRPPESHVPSPGSSYESDAAWDEAADLRREAWEASPFFAAFEALSGRLGR